LTLNADGTYTYAATTAAADALAPTETAVDYFTYTISDGSSTDTAELRITVTGINNAPTSTSPPQVNAVENQKIIIQSKTFFDDPDPKNNTFGQLTYTTGGLPAGLLINDQGKIVGRLPEGTYTFTVTATDGGNLSSQQTFTIVVGKPGKPGEKPPKPIRINFKTIDDAVERQVVVFREEAPKRANAQMETLEVGSSLESIVKDYTFNGGMKVIDVAVEDLNLKGNDSNFSDGGNIGVQENTILGFAIGDDYRLNVKQYTGALEDGSALPNWVKVDPATGQTIVQFPDNIFSINVKVIAIDKDSTTREIKVTLDKNSVRQDQSLKRDLKPFVDRSTSLKSEVTIDDRGQVFIEASNDGERDINRTQNLNSSNVPNTTDDILSTLQYEAIEKEGDLFRIKISEDTRKDSTKYSLRFSNQIDSMQDQLPSWILIDRNTGEIQARPPSGIDSIELEVLAEDKDGNVRSLEIDLDFTQDDLSLNIENPQLDEKIVEFASLQDQINLEFDGYENYGDKLTKASS
jgi:VCBS repeat-containing protein